MVEYEENSTVLSVVLQKKKIKWRDKITANMNISFGNYHNIYIYICQLLFYKS